MWIECMAIHSVLLTGGLDVSVVLASRTGFPAGSGGNFLYFGAGLFTNYKFALGSRLRLKAA
jgi:hypothetical protein